MAMKKITRLFVLTFFLAAIPLSHAMDAISREIHYLTGCNKDEVVDDLVHSISSSTEYLARHRIKVIEVERSSECGYRLVHGPDKQQFAPAGTSGDFHTTVRDFFGLQD